MVPQLCFDVRRCQKCLGCFHPLPEMTVAGSWSVDEHDPLAFQLKLVGRLDYAGPRSTFAIPDFRTRLTNAVYELQLQSLESENRSYRLSSLPWFSHNRALPSH